MIYITSYILPIKNVTQPRTMITQIICTEEEDICKYPNASLSRIAFVTASDLDRKMATDQIAETFKIFDK